MILLINGEDSCVGNFGVQFLDDSLIYMINEAYFYSIFIKFVRPTSSLLHTAKMTRMSVVRSWFLLFRIIIIECEISCLQQNDVRKNCFRIHILVFFELIRK